MWVQAVGKIGKAACTLACITFGLRVVPLQMAAAQVGISPAEKISQVVRRTTVELYSIVDQSARSGDLFTLKAALELIFSLDAWHRANVDEPDLPFGALRAQENGLLSNAHSMTKQLRNKAYSGAENLKTAKALAGQLVQSIPQGTSKTLVFPYQPLIFPQKENEFLDLSLNGLNLVSGQTTLFLQKKGPPRKFSRATTLAQEPTKITFRLNRPDLPAEDAISAHVFTLSYQYPREGFFSRLIGRNEYIVREVSFYTVPPHLARYDFETTFEEPKYERKAFTSAARVHEGSGQTSTGLALPETGWQWDTSKPITPVTSDENHGRFEKISRKDENGIEYQVRLDHQPKTGQGETAKQLPGKIRVSLQGTIKRTVTIRQTANKSGTIGWIEDVKLDVPGQKPSWKLKIRLFDGRVREFSDSSPVQADTYFMIQTDGNILVVKPRVPRELLD